MRTRVRLIIISAVVYLLAVTLIVGCVIQGEIGSGDELPEEVADAAQSQVSDAETEDEGPPMPVGSHHGTEVLMMGRSVMNGWFDHWGYDYMEPVMREGYLLYFHELATPPDIGADAASAIAEVPDGTIVFFKLCFDDFWANDESEVQANVDEAIGYVNQVRAACEGRDLTLIVGNALPKTNPNTTLGLVRTHRAYNDALDALAADDDQMVVFDQYDLLADQNGGLYKGLALATDDSHLNETAYEVLDEAFFELLGSL